MGMASADTQYHACCVHRSSKPSSDTYLFGWGRRGAAPGGGGGARKGRGRACIACTACCMPQLHNRAPCAAWWARAAARLSLCPQRSSSGPQLREGGCKTQSSLPSPRGTPAALNLTTRACSKGHLNHTHGPAPPRLAGCRATA